MNGHQTAAQNNDNVSSTAIKLTAYVGEDFSKSVAASLITLGGEVHGPTGKAREVIAGWTDDQIINHIRKGKRVPGWGNAFFKGRMDPAWDDMNELIQTEYSVYANRLDRISAIIEKEKGIRLYPNAAAFTAITASILELAKGIEILLVIAARLPVWANQYVEQERC